MTSFETVFLLFTTLINASLQKYTKHQHGVGCYECHSINGSDVHCGDPFHPAHNVNRYIPRCEQGIGTRIGKFPARYCTKIKGTNLVTNEVLIVRSCSMHPLDNTCGLFKFENTRYSGCLMSCNRDACNTAPHKAGFSPGYKLQITLTFIAVCLSLLTYFPFFELL
ncbi:hypothetical protein EGW08_002731 [Elysia chlorotica]|uniref:Protein sleepless n=1 Tax=Elysia chlorotica TaxID=188477 RepID=A0A433U739_ELYCH|nr:hypothetical protein EGW08_002731 [Elysia chlorotica]